MTPEQQNQLERLVNRATADLPPRPAPRSLESRVRAELERRAALPWWRKSFGYWPVGAQVALGLLCLAAATSVLKVVMWTIAGLPFTALKGMVATGQHGAEIAIGAVKAIGEAGASIVSAIPPLWLYGGAAIIAALYVALFGLGAAAYRTLYAHS